MKENEIDAVAFIANTEPLLSGDKREIVAEFEQETFQLEDNASSSSFPNTHP